MMGKKSVVATKLSVEQSKGLITHYQGHSFSIALQDLTACCKMLCDTIGTMRRICVLVKYSPKQESVFGRMQENRQGKLDLETDKFLALERLYPTCSTVCTSCF